MTDQTTEAMRTAMRQLADMAPAAPDLPSVEHHARGRRPVAAFAAGFALVLVVGGVGAVLVVQTTDESHDASAISPPTSATDLETTPTTALQQDAGSFVVYGSDNGVEDGCGWKLDATASGTWMIGACGLLEFTEARGWSYATNIPFPHGAMDVAVAANGTVWIGNVDTGVVSYNQESLFEHDVIAPWIEITPDGTVWGWRLGGGLVSFDGVAWVDEPDVGSVTDLAVDDGGTLWVVEESTSDIKELTAGGWVLHEPPEDISTILFGSGWDLISTPDGIALFNDDAVLRFNGGDWMLVAVPSLTSLGIVPTARYEDEPLDVVDTLEATDAAVAANGDVWIASTQYGALRYREDAWVRYTTEDGLASNHLTFVEVGPDGSVWFGSDDAGLTRLLTVPSTNNAP